jgi:hypothetical protein
VDRDARSGLCGSGFGEVKWAQIVDIVAVRTLRQFGEDVSQPGEWLHDQAFVRAMIAASQAENANMSATLQAHDQPESQKAPNQHPRPSVDLVPLSA